MKRQDVKSNIFSFIASENAVKRWRSRDEEMEISRDEEMKRRRDEEMKR